MRDIILVLIIIFTSLSSVDAQEITLFNKDGNAIAYIDYEKDATIFLWNGTPVAFLKKDSADVGVIGFNGEFLGWYKYGVIYDKEGYTVGTRLDGLTMDVKTEPIKRKKKEIPSRPLISLKSTTPIWNSKWSSLSLIEFLYSGNN